MSQATLSTSPDTFVHGSGDRLLAEFQKANANFDELYAASSAAATKVIPTYTVATVPAAASNTRVLIHVSNGSAGAPCLALSDGTNWKVVATYGSNIAAA